MNATGVKPRREVLVLVHGTFAGRAEDEGKSWWQLGSRTWCELRKRVPSNVVPPPSGKPFHWSGENSERARMKAAGELVAYLRGLESEGCNYHLIGHSHGGSVIWNALRLGVLQGRPLRGLLSWATVGTPFLHLRPRVGGNLLHWLNLVLAIILAKPAILTLTRLVGLLVSPESSYWLGGQGSQSVDRITFWNTPVLWLLQGLGESVQLTSNGVRIGSFDPARTHSATEFLLFSPEGWLLVGTAVLVIYVFLILATFLLSPLFEALRLRAEQRLERRTFDSFGQRWLGLWSPDDEAINGLRATLDLSVSFVSRMTTREPILVSDYVAILSRPYYWVLTPLFNGGLRPLLEGVVRSFVIKRAQGNNRPSAAVVEVSPAPISGERRVLFPPLPPHLNARVVDCANERARGIVAQLRRLLATPSIVSGLEEFGQTLTGRELVHTSYFDHPEVLDLLTMHIAWARGARDWQSCRFTKDMGLVEWLRAAKEGVGATMPNEFTPHSSQLPHLIEPRRRTTGRVA